MEPCQGLATYANPGRNGNWKFLFLRQEYMENSYAVRVSFPYLPEDEQGVFRRHCVRGIVAAWSTHVSRMVVYEHDDDNAARVHCHLMIEGSRISKKRLQQLAGVAAPLKILVPGHRASSYMSFRTAEYDGHIAGFAYCTKGKYDPKYLQGWSVEETERWKAAWVPPADHIRRSPWRVLLDAYEEWTNDKVRRLDYDVEVTTAIICSRVQQFLLQRHSGIYPPQAKTERWFLVTNLCLSHKAKFPDLWKI